MPANNKLLAAAVRARRDELDLTQVGVGANGGPSNATLTKIESGDAVPLSRATLRKLDAGLEWEQGSARDVLNGGDPRPLERDRPRPSEALRRIIGDYDLADRTRDRLLAILDEEEAG